MRIPDELLPHKGTAYQLLLEPGPVGDRYGDPVTVPRSQVDRVDRMVRDSDGAEMLSGTTVYLDLADDEAGTMRDLSAGAKVTVHSGTSWARTSTVISVAYREHPAVAEFMEVYLR